MQTLSSGLTFFFKLLFPFVWISMFGLGTLGLWLGSFHGGNGFPPDTNMKWLFLVIWIFGTLFLVKSLAALKQVRVDSRFLYISNYFREAVVPLPSVTNVTENYWLNTHPVTVYFIEEMEFGDQITFMPKVRFFGLFSSHPVVAELRRLVEIASASGQT